MSASCSETSNGRSYCKRCYRRYCICKERPCRRHVEARQPIKHCWRYHEGSACARAPPQAVCLSPNPPRPRPDPAPCYLQCILNYLAQVYPGISFPPDDRTVALFDALGMYYVPNAQTPAYLLPVPNTGRTNVFDEAQYFKLMRTPHQVCDGIQWSSPSGRTPSLSRVPPAAGITQPGSFLGLAPGHAWGLECLPNGLFADFVSNQFHQVPRAIVNRERDEWQWENGECGPLRPPLSWLSTPPGVTLDAINGVHDALPISPDDPLGIPQQGQAPRPIGLQPGPGGALQGGRLLLRQLYGLLGPSFEPCKDDQFLGTWTMDGKSLNSAEETQRALRRVCTQKDAKEAAMAFSEASPAWLDGIRGQPVEVSHVGITPGFAESPGYWFNSFGSIGGTGVWYEPGSGPRTSKAIQTEFQQALLDYPQLDLVGTTPRNRLSMLFHLLYEVAHAAVLPEPAGFAADGQCYSAGPELLKAMYGTCDPWTITMWIVNGVYDETDTKTPWSNVHRSSDQPRRSTLGRRREDLCAAPRDAPPHSCAPRGASPQRQHPYGFVRAPTGSCASRNASPPRHPPYGSVPAPGPLPCSSSCRAQNPAALQTRLCHEPPSDSDDGESEVEGPLLRSMELKGRLAPVYATDHYGCRMTDSNIWALPPGFSCGGEPLPAMGPSQKVRRGSVSAALLAGVRWLGCLEEVNIDEATRNLVDLYNNCLYAQTCAALIYAERGNDAYALNLIEAYNHGWDGDTLNVPPRGSDIKFALTRRGASYALAKAFCSNWWYDRAASSIAVDETIFYLANVLRYETLQMPMNANIAGSWSPAIVELRQPWEVLADVFAANCWTFPSIARNWHSDIVKMRKYAFLAGEGYTTLAVMLNNAMVGQVLCTLRDPMDPTNPCCIRRLGNVGGFDWPPAGSRWHLVPLFEFPLLHPLNHGCGWAAAQIMNDPDVEQSYQSRAYPDASVPVAQSMILCVGDGKKLAFPCWGFFAQPELYNYEFAGSTPGSERGSLGGSLPADMPFPLSAFYQNVPYGATGFGHSAVLPLLPLAGKL